MISSEVQRTLVKSPPELWAELSDPALLARHLGELGEIRITRVEPEKTVEWEAEHTNGMVQIKPSGWGTRVTLTVTREPPEKEAEEAAPAGAPPASQPTPQSEAGHTPQPEAEPEQQADPELGAEAGAASIWHAEPEPAGEVDGDPAWLAEEVASFTPEPLPDSDVQQEAAAEIHAEGDVEAETEPLGGETLPPQPYAWLMDDEPEPRRGFFARLFGRGRRPRRTGPEAIESLGEMDPVSELAEEIAPDDAEPQAPAAWEHVGTLAPSAADASLAPVSESWQPDPPSEPGPDPAPVDDGRACAQIDQPEDAPPEPVHAPDTSSELKAAEEAATDEEEATAEEEAAAELKAVLTSVLDRLGAAHHRPFSRS